MTRQQRVDCTLEGPHGGGEILTSIEEGDARVTSRRRMPVRRRARSRRSDSRVIRLQIRPLRHYAVNALNLTQKDLRHLKREFDEIDVDQSGLLLCGFTPSTRAGAVAATPSSRDRATQAPWTPSNFLTCSTKKELL